MGRFLGWKSYVNHPFYLLLYLEWILLGIAVLATFAPPPHVFPATPPYGLGMSIPPPRPRLPPTHVVNHIGFIPGILASITSLGLMGLRLPQVHDPLIYKVLYTALGFGLSGLAVLFGGRGANFFSALLLVVVVRGCLLFPWHGRAIVALVAYVSFLGMLAGTILKGTGFWYYLSRMSHQVHEPSDLIEFLSPQWQGFILHLTVNSALLFALVLVFMLLLIGALLNEKQSRQDLKIAHRQLRQYALLVENQAALQERNRIAREIHDSVGHYLTAQSIQLENAAVFLAQDPPKAQGYVQEAQRLGKEALKDVRHSVSALRADPLKGKTLEAALQELLQEVKQTTGIRIESKIKLKSALSKKFSTALYRVVQEALTNVARHSQATRVKVYVMEVSGMVCLRLQDNGRGFERDLNSTGFGLQGMQDRIQAIAGRFEIKSQSGKGCQVEADIPIH
ncbi:sensor histidine kinase [Roseofilum sp. BLCC_M154]|uniref:histidine kinase n=1 Tax=Roseofilum acuticapitatum BLCC-M154 TaxID=3022444 RepID=A0ABT7AVU4_9CYAN|nr:sensor histidine kinase [Roseofilum acuticapitatum]MDJ1170183.1 sensor histidine kinase [Roseofilum acuticapitatum BLCC-M154]